MTAQLSERFINNHKVFAIEGYNLYGISLSKPNDYKNWVCYPIKSKADPKKLSVFTACWKGYIGVYELNESGKLTLTQFEYPSFEEKIESDLVYEILKGDFWLEFRTGFFGDKLFVPFIDGELEVDNKKWVMDKKKITSSLSDKIHNWFFSLRSLF